MLTRDSLIWWVGLAGAMLAYLATAPPPTKWHYAEAIQFASVVIAFISGKLATSPLKGKAD